MDTQDAKWAVDASAFPPDKASTWAHPPEADGWTLAHNSLRQELDLFSAALAATAARNAGTAPAAWEVDCLRRWWKAHHAHVQTHHANEDDLFNPFLREKIALPQKLDADHTVLVDNMAKIDALVAAVSTESATGVKDLLACWDTYAGLMKSHLLEEEHIGIPLMRAFFTPKEVSPIIQKIVGSVTAPKEEMGSFIYFLTEAKFRNEFMKQEGIPFFVWYLDFKAKLNYYETNVAAQIDALKSGSPPEPPSSGACALC
ncbi:hypothetical protein M885DRAFT_530575 [Pelagophyceae sp. CCMP2097]|nr:hypothetical protein M885DRAFT_530575 [Pelagophyceae sp. CCMP2097]